MTPALSAQGDTVEHPGPLDVDGGDGPDDSHPRHRPHQPVHLRVDMYKDNYRYISILCMSHAHHTVHHLLDKW